MMHILRTFRHLFDGKRDLAPFFTRQAELLCQCSDTLVRLCQCSDTLVRMLENVDPVQWNMLQREIKACETQGDALLQDFREQLSERLMGSLNRTDLSTIAMSMDDSLDVIKDAAKAVQIYKPRKIDQQLRDLAQLIRGEAYALQELLPLIWHIRDKASAISLLCGVSGGLRFAPAPPNVSCVPASGNLYPSGPSPYTCPGVDKPPDTPYPYKEQKP